MMDVEAIKKSKTTKELIEFGIINIDKSSGPTSFSVSHFVKKKLCLKKTSHFGTLDPKVTGVLPVSLGRGCKVMGYFLGEDKTYVGIARFHDEFSIEQLEEKIKEKFMGEIIQMPPLKSRVKRQLRPRTIYSFDILEKDGTDFLFKVKCQGGTYIRTLIDNLGKELNSGAHMLELRRTNAGIFFEDDEKYPSIRLYDFLEAVEKYKEGDDEKLRKMIIPAEIVCALHKNVEVKPEQIESLWQGKPLYKKDIISDFDSKEGDLIAVHAGVVFIGMFNVIGDGDIVGKGDFVFQPIRN